MPNANTYVSNSNGVNFNGFREKSRAIFLIVSNSNGVNFNDSSRNDAIITHSVSNSNGVNFNWKMTFERSTADGCFKLQRSKF